jgi:hypothetical protein
VAPLPTLRNCAAVTAKTWFPKAEYKSFASAAHWADLGLKAIETRFSLLCAFSRASNWQLMTIVGKPRQVSAGHATLSAPVSTRERLDPQRGSWAAQAHFWSRVFQI